MFIVSSQGYFLFPSSLKTKISDQTLLNYSIVYSTLAGFSCICSVAFHGLVSDIGTGVDKTKISSIMAVNISFCVLTFCVQAVNLGITIFKLIFFSWILLRCSRWTTQWSTWRFRSKVFYMHLPPRLVIIVIMLSCGYYTVFKVPEPDSNYHAISSTPDFLPNPQSNPPIYRKIFHFFTVSTWEPFRSRDFCLVFVSRFLFQVSVSTMQQASFSRSNTPLP